MFNCCGDIRGLEENQVAVPGEKINVGDDEHTNRNNVVFDNPLLFGVENDEEDNVHGHAPECVGLTEGTHGDHRMTNPEDFSEESPKPPEPTLEESRRRASVDFAASPLNVTEFANGQYQGDLVDGKRHGKGKLIYNNGNCYDGTWENDQRHGEGTFVGTTSNYQGFFLNDVRHGYGKEKWEDSNQYEGNYENDKKHGHGRFQWPDGCVYDGGFLENRVHGEGKFTWKDGRKYRGDWVSDKMHGYGTYNWPDGRSYEGEYMNDMKHGFGSFIWADGRKFTGTWAQSRQHGHGVFRTADGSERKGTWRNGRRDRWINDDSENSEDTTENPIKKEESSKDDIQKDINDSKDGPIVPTSGFSSNTETNKS